MKLHWWLAAFIVVMACAVPTNGFAQNYCEEADPNDEFDDREALQACLDGGGTILLSSGSTGYLLVSGGLRLREDYTYLSSANEYDRATIWAHSSLNDEMLRAEANYFEISFLIFDGNIANRGCPSYPNGHNLIVDDSYGFVIRYVDSIGAACGSALEVTGGGFSIYNNEFSWNGNSSQIADGMTVHRCDGGEILGNQFGNNSDIGLVINEGTDCTVRWNIIWNSGQFAFAGMHISKGDYGDHSGGLYSDNEIYASEDLMSYGLIIGSYPWHLDRVADAGTVGWNYIEGAVINLSVDRVDAGYIVGNDTYLARGYNGYLSCYNDPAEFIAYDNGGSLTLQSGWVERTCRPY